MSYTLKAYCIDANHVLKEAQHSIDMKNEYIDWRGKVYSDMNTLIQDAAVQINQYYEMCILENDVGLATAMSIMLEGVE